MKIVVNDQIVEREQFIVDLEDRGYQFGDGIYEVVRIYDGRFFTLDEHLSRLQSSADKLKLKLPVEIDTLKQSLKHLIELESIQDGIVYIQVTRGVAPRVHYFPANIQAILTAYATPLARPIDLLDRGVATILHEDVRWLRCDIKSINLLGNVLAKEAAHEANAYEAILHRGEIVTEGSSTNIWIVSNGNLITHPISNLILNGITRQVVLQLAQQLNIEVIEKEYTVHDLLQADEVFLTSTTSEVMPIIRINEKIINNGTPGPITKRLQTAFNSRINALLVNA